MGGLPAKIQLNFRSTEPLYLQIAAQIERMVVSGDLKVGDQLPTVRQLATQLRINFNTVARAYRFLDDARLISTQRGRGTYIWEEPGQDALLQIGRQRFYEMTRHFLAGIQDLGFSVEEAVDVLRHLQVGDLNPPSGFNSAEDDPDDPGSGDGLD